MTGHSKTLSLEGAVSLNPKDYVWGPVSAAQQHQMFAQFMGMTQVALMCGCALLPPPGIAPLHTHHPSAATLPLGAPNHAFPAFWLPMPPRPLAGPFPPVIPMPEKAASLPSALLLGPSPAVCWAPAPPASTVLAPTHTSKKKNSSSNDLSAATHVAAPEVKSASGSANPSHSRAPALKKRTSHKSNGSRSKAGGAGAKAMQQAAQGSAAAAAMPGGSACLAMPEGCSLDLLEAVPLDLDEIRQLFQEDLAQELQKHQCLSSRTSQGSQDTMFHSAADATTALAPLGCLGGHSQELLLESLDGPLSLASFDQSFEQLSQEFKAIGNSFDALADLGSILDVHMDDDLSLVEHGAPGPAPEVKLAAMAVGKQQVLVPAPGSSGASKGLKLNRSKSGVVKKGGDKGAVKVTVPRGTSCISLVDTPLELLRFV